MRPLKCNAFDRSYRLVARQSLVGISLRTPLNSGLEKPIAATPWQDIPALYQRLNKPSPTHFAIRFAILTCVRSAGVRKAMFDEIDGDVWTVPADRVKGAEGQVSAFRVPLSQAALRVVQDATEWRVSDYMFPGQSKGAISDQALTKALNALGEVGRVHGFRTSFRTWAQDMDVSYDVAETTLGHVIGGKIERTYARSDLLDQRRVLMEKWGAFVSGQPAQVVKLRGDGSG